MPRSFQPGSFYHVTSRGNNGREIFRDDEDCAAFVSLVARTAVRFGMNVHAWCPITNHYHLIVETTTGSVSGAFHCLNTHLEAACAYVLLNPVRAGLVPTAEDWGWAGVVGSPA